MQHEPRIDSITVQIVDNSDENRYDDGIFRIGRKYGFLPQRNPLARLPDPFGPVQSLLDDLPVYLRDMLPQRVVRKVYAVVKMSALPGALEIYSTEGGPVAAGVWTKLDLGWVVQGWPDDTMAPAASEGGYVDMYGMPSRDEVIGHYADVSGRQVDDIDYYCVLAKWKLAVVLEQGFQRAANDPKLNAFGPIVLQLMQGAADLAESTDYGR